MSVDNKLVFLPVGQVPSAGAMGVNDRVLITTPDGIKSIPASAVGVDSSGDPVVATAETIQFDRAATGTVPQSIYVITKEREISLSEFNGVTSGLADLGSAAANAAAFSNFFRACNLEKRQGVIPQGDYVINPVYLTGLNSFFIRMHPESRIRGMKSYQLFAGNGTQTVFAVTEFAVTLASGYLVASKFDANGQESAWLRGVNYDSTATTVTLRPGNTIATGESIRIASNESLIALIGNAPIANVAPRFRWEGGTIDINERGCVLSQASGSGLSLNNFQSIDLHGLDLYGAASYEAAVIKGVADSGLTILGASNGEISGCKFIGLNDLGIYVTGGGNLNASDDGRSFLINNNHFLECRGALGAKREVKDVIVSNNTFYKCRFPVALAYTLPTDPGSGKGSIHGNTFRRCGARAIWAMLQRGCVISGNTIIDGGYLADGVSLDNSQSTVEAIFVEGCTDTRVSNNNIVFDELAPHASMRGIRISKRVHGSTTYESNNNTITNNSIRGVGTGIIETDAGTGNILRENDFMNVATPYSVPTTRRWQYRVSNQEFEGIGAKSFVGTFVPQVQFVGGAATITYTAQYGRYVRVGNLVHYWVRLAWSAVHSLTTQEFRVTGLPYSAESDTNHRSSGVVGVLGAGAAVPAGSMQVTGRVIFGNNYVRLESIVPGVGSTIWAANQFPQNTGQILELQGTYEVAAEAQN